MSTPATNGKAALNGAAKVETTVTVAKPEATVKALPAAKSTGADLKPLEDRLHRLNQLFALQQKYNRLQNSLLKLKEFELEANNETASIEFTDDKRNRFSTSNKEIILELREFLMARIAAKIKEIEPLLNW